MFAQERTFLRARLHMLCQLVGMGRHTVTGILRTAGQIFTDWSADYRLYSKERFDSEELFDSITHNVLKFIPKDQPFSASMDDSLLRKGGNHTHGVGWRRDPLSPPFNTNFIKGQRILQLSASLPAGDGSARAIPIDFQHAVLPKKPHHKAPESEFAAYRKAQKESNINTLGAARIRHLREQLDGVDASRGLLVSVDGRFTNKIIFQGLPANATLIGRIRKDAKLNYPVSEAERAATGRRRIYGEEAPTPEALLQDKRVPWQRVEAYAAGKTHRFKIKRLGPLKWRKAGGQRDLQLVVIAPLGYRLRKGGKLLYRQPAFLICTDPDLDLPTLLQNYLWRWDIEVNFRDEKTLLGLGQAQVRGEASTQNVPALSVASYALLMLASVEAFGVDGRPDALPTPIWQRGRIPPRVSTMSLIDHLRYELWARALRPESFSDFLSPPGQKEKPEKLDPSLVSALFCAVN